MARIRRQASQRRARCRRANFLRARRMVFSAAVADSAPASETDFDSLGSMGLGNLVSSTAGSSGGGLLAEQHEDLGTDEGHIAGTEGEYDVAGAGALDEPPRHPRPGRLEQDALCGKRHVGCHELPAYSRLGILAGDVHIHHHHLVGSAEGLPHPGAGRGVVAFQSHMVSRTPIFGAAMGPSPGAADEVVVMDVYVAREDPEPGVSGQLVAANVPLPAERVLFEPSWSRVPGRLVERARAGAGAESATAAEKTIRRARKKFARRQRARRWLAWRRILAIVLVAAAAAGSVWLMLFSSVLAVADVSVDGNEVLDPQQVRRAAAVPTGEPLATVDLDAIAARIEALPPVKSVDVSRAWPDRVRIAIRERDAVAVLERDGAVRGVDDEGVLFRSYPSVPNGLPVVRMGAGTESDALAEATTVVGVLPRNLATMVDFVEVDTIDTISLRLRSGPTIFWGSADDSANKAKVIAVLLKQEASTYDVSVPAQPTIRR